MCPRRGRSSRMDRLYLGPGAERRGHREKGGALPVSGTGLRLIPKPGRAPQSPFRPTGVVDSQGLTAASRPERRLRSSALFSSPPDHPIVRAGRVGQGEGLGGGVQEGQGQGQGEGGPGRHRQGHRADPGGDGDRRRQHCPGGLRLHRLTGSAPRHDNGGCGPLFLIGQPQSEGDFLRGTHHLRDTRCLPARQEAVGSWQVAGVRRLQMSRVFSQSWLRD